MTKKLSADELNERIQKKRKERDQVHDELTGLVARRNAAEQEERAAEAVHEAAKITNKEGKPPMQTLHLGTGEVTVEKPRR